MRDVTISGRDYVIKLAFVGSHMECTKVEKRLDDIMTSRDLFTDDLEDVLRPSSSHLLSDSDEESPPLQKRSRSSATTRYLPNAVEYSPHRMRQINPTSMSTPATNRTIIDESRRVSDLQQQMDDGMYFIFHFV